MNNVKELTNRIHKHCPDLKEKTVGCRLLVSHPEYRNIVVDTITQDIKHTVEMARQSKMPDYLGDCYFVTRGYASDRAEKLLGRRDLGNVFIIEEVIGHPIQLHHVMKAIGNMLVVVDCAGNFYTLEMRLNDKLPRFSKCVARYDLNRSFEENMKNRDLLEFLLEVIK